MDSKKLEIRMMSLEDQARESAELKLKVMTLEKGLVTLLDKD